MLGNRQKGKEGSMRRKNFVSREADLERHCCSLRVVSTVLRDPPKCSHHKFSPTAEGMLSLYHNTKHKHGPQAPLAGVSEY